MPLLIFKYMPNGIPEWGHFPQLKIVFLWSEVGDPHSRNTAAFQANYQLYPKQYWFSLEYSFILPLFSTCCLIWVCRPLDEGTILLGPVLMQNISLYNDSYSTIIIVLCTTFPCKLKFTTELSWLNKLLRTKWAMITIHMNAFSPW